LEEAAESAPHLKATCRALGVFHLFAMPQQPTDRRCERWYSTHTGRSDRTAQAATYQASQAYEVIVKHPTIKTVRPANVHFPERLIAVRCVQTGVLPVAAKPHDVVPVGAVDYRCKRNGMFRF